MITLIKQPSSYQSNSCPNNTIVILSAFTQKKSKKFVFKVIFNFLQNTYPCDPACRCKSLIHGKITHFNRSSCLHKRTTVSYQRLCQLYRLLSRAYDLVEFHFSASLKMGFFVICLMSSSTSKTL